MLKDIKKYQRLFLIGLIVICMGIMAIGAAVYLERIKDRLKDDAIQDVMDLTLQQRQAFENFVSEDRERLHSYAEYFSQNGHDASENDLIRLAVCRGRGLVCVS